MGKLRRKIFWGSMAFFFAFLLWEGGRHGLRQVLRELEETHRIVVRVERTVPLFLGFALRGVRVSGEGFAFQAPEVSVRLSWNRGISAVIEDGEFAFSSGLPWSALESLPPLFVEVRRARLSGQNLPPWDGWLEKSGTVLRFGIAAGDLEARGTVEGGKAVLEGKYRTLPFWGSFVPAEGRFEGELGEGSRRVHLEGILSRKTQGWELSPLQVDHGGLLFSGRLFRGDDGRFVLSGRVRVLEEDIDVSLQGSNTQTSFEGNFEGKSATSTLSGRFRADLWNSSFLLEFAPQSVWRGVRLSGRLEGSVDDGLRLNFYDLFVSPEEGCTLFPVRGSGRIQGEVKKRGELWQGEIAFSSPEILIDRLGLQGVSARIALDGGRVTFSGSGHMLGGNLELSGSYESGVIQASGRVQGITLEGILEQSGVPLSGTFSGDLSCTGRVGDFRLVLRLTNGSLSWQGVDLGSIAGGEVLLEGERVEVRNLLVTRGSGKLSGNVTRDASGIRGKGEFAGYPLEVSWKGKTAGFILWGSVALEWGKEHCLGLSLSSPSWFFGNLQGRDLSISGAVRGKEITLNFLALQGDAAGNKVIRPLKDVQASREHQAFTFPTNQHAPGERKLQEIRLYHESILKGEAKFQRKRNFRHYLRQGIKVRRPAGLPSPRIQDGFPHHEISLKGALPLLPRYHEFTTPSPLEYPLKPEKSPISLNRSMKDEALSGNLTPHHKLSPEERSLPPGKPPLPPCEIPLKTLQGKVFSPTSKDPKPLKRHRAFRNRRCVIPKKV